MITVPSPRVEASLEPTSVEPGTTHDEPPPPPPVTAGTGTVAATAAAATEAATAATEPDAATAAGAGRVQGVDRCVRAVTAASRALTPVTARELCDDRRIRRGRRRRSASGRRQLQDGQRREDTTRHWRQAHRHRRRRRRARCLPDSPRNWHPPAKRPHRHRRYRWWATAPRWGVRGAEPPSPLAVPPPPPGVKAASAPAEASTPSRPPFPPAVTPGGVWTPPPPPPAVTNGPAESKIAASAPTAPTALHAAASPSAEATGATVVEESRGGREPTRQPHRPRSAAPCPGPRSHADSPSYPTTASHVPPTPPEPPVAMIDTPQIPAGTVNVCRDPVATKVCATGTAPAATGMARTARDETKGPEQRARAQPQPATDQHGPQPPAVQRSSDGCRGNLHPTPAPGPRRHRLG